MTLIIIFLNIRNEKNNKTFPFGHNNIICYSSAQDQSHIAFSENEIHMHYVIS